MARSKQAKTMAERYGVLPDGRLKHFVVIGSKGGSRPNLHGFTNNPEQAKKAGSLSKRGKKLIAHTNLTATYEDLKTGDTVTYNRETNEITSTIKRIKRGR